MLDSGYWRAHLSNAHAAYIDVSFTVVRFQIGEQQISKFAAEALPSISYSFFNFLLLSTQTGTTSSHSQPSKAASEDELYVGLSSQRGYR